MFILLHSYGSCTNQRASWRQGFVPSGGNWVSKEQTLPQTSEAWASWVLTNSCEFAFPSSLYSCELLCYNKYVNVSVVLYLVCLCVWGGCECVCVRERERDKKSPEFATKHFIKCICACKCACVVCTLHSDMKDSSAYHPQTCKSVSYTTCKLVRGFWKLPSDL